MEKRSLNKAASDAATDTASGLTNKYLDYFYIGTAVMALVGVLLYWISKSVF